MACRARKEAEDPGFRPRQYAEEYPEGMNGVPVGMPCGLPGWEPMRPSDGGFEMTRAGYTPVPLPIRGVGALLRLEHFSGCTASEVLLVALERLERDWVLSST